MNTKGVRAYDGWMKNCCPYCLKKIGIIAGWKRKIKKVCYCPKCHKKIDERFVIH